MPYVLFNDTSCTYPTWRLQTGSDGQSWADLLGLKRVEIWPRRDMERHGKEAGGVIQCGTYYSHDKGGGDDHSDHGHGDNFLPNLLRQA